MTNIFDSSSIMSRFLLGYWSDIFSNSSWKVIFIKFFFFKINYCTDYIKYTKDIISDLFIIKESILASN